MELELAKGPRGLWRLIRPLGGPPEPEGIRSSTPVQSLGGGGELPDESVCNRLGRPDRLATIIMLARELIASSLRVISLMPLIPAIVREAIVMLSANCRSQPERPSRGRHQSWRRRQKRGQLAGDEISFCRR